MEIFYQDHFIVVCVKPAGVLSQEGPGQTMPALLREAGCGAVFPVHRLDTPAAGGMVFAKTKQAAAALSRQISAGEMQKEYLCAVHGVPAETSGEYTDLLFKDAKKNKSYVASSRRVGVREAKLSYAVLSAAGTPAGQGSLVRVRLFTGRTHQIRVQFSSRGMPLFGDGKYGARDHLPSLALWSVFLSFRHPQSGAPLSFSFLPPAEAPWNWFPAQEG